MINARFAAYMQTHKITDASVVNNLDYVNWVQSKWSEWSELTGRYRPYMRQDHVDFTAWLQEEAKA